MDVDPFIVALTSDASGVVQEIEHEEAEDIVDETHPELVTTTVLFPCLPCVEHVLSCLQPCIPSH